MRLTTLVNVLESTVYIYTDTMNKVIAILSICFLLSLSSHSPCAINWQ